MSYSNPERPSEQQVKEQLPHLCELAELLLERWRTQRAPLVIIFIGAGASRSAGLPTSEELKHQIYRNLVDTKHGTSEPFAEVLDKEAEFLFGEKACDGILKLSLFEFASVVSQFAYGRTVIHDELSSVLRRGSCRPLAYELLAHLAKHGFLDHFVSLNFDELLDEALADEIPDRIRFITSHDELPGPRALHEPGQRTVFLFKPFGSLSKDIFRLRPEDTDQYGSDSIWKFMMDSAFRKETGDRKPRICLLLVGYAASEPAFGKLLTELKSDGRELTLFAISTAEELSDTLQSSCQNHIKLDANVALDLLLKIIRKKYLEDRNHHVWIPVSRHRVVSHCLDLNAIRTPRHRFKTELILQAVKSRGFFTIEAVADIERIRKYASEAWDVIEEMCKEGILKAHPWTGNKTEEDPPLINLRQDYCLEKTDYKDLASHILEVCKRKSDDLIDEWEIEGSSALGWEARVERITLGGFLDKRFTEIAHAPEIEVVDNASPATHWLFRDAEPLRSIADLTKKTYELFNKAFCEADDQIELYGIWTTGEWLFHDDGWAWGEFGEEVVKRLDEKKLEMHLIVSKTPPIHMMRRDRAEEVRRRLKPFRDKNQCKLIELDWWRHNRTLTLLRWRPKGPTRKQNSGGIYMRRRLATPLVAPVYVRDKDCEVLLDIFRHYKRKRNAVRKGTSI